MADALSSFIEKYNGKRLTNNGGVYLGECVSLIKRYAQEVQKVPNADDVLRVPQGAKQLYQGFNWNGKMSKYYDKIPYGKPVKRGDFIVWGTNKGSYGHVGLSLGSGLKVFEQLGTPDFIPSRLATESGTPLGYLRRKGIIEDMKTSREDSVYLNRIARFVHSPTEKQKRDWTGRDLTPLLSSIYGTTWFVKNKEAVKNYDKVVAENKVLKAQLAGGEAAAKDSIWQKLKGVLGK